MMLGAYDGRNGKPVDAFRRQHEAWRRSYAAASCVHERFPKVETLVIDLVFTDARRMGRYSPQMRSFSGSAKAFFAIACPRTLCLDGGFDLDPILLSMFGAERTMLKGTLECRGWTDPTRAENARCLLCMHYRLDARYDAPHASTANRRVRVRLAAKRSD
jgi:hypothetical protein